MIDLHTHTLFSDGQLLPSELVRRAEVKGYTAIALTDHVDFSNIDFVLPRIVKVCKVLNRHWKIRSIPGVEITHVPVEEIKPLVRFARRNGAKLVLVHGETLSEPVIAGTNKRAIEAGCDILAHPGMITEKEVQLAKERNVYLELTTRKNHSRTNSRLFKMAKRIGARVLLNNDAHSDCDLLTHDQAKKFLRNLGLQEPEIKAIFRNAQALTNRATS